MVLFIFSVKVHFYASCFPFNLPHSGYSSYLMGKMTLLKVTSSLHLAKSSNYFSVHPLPHHSSSHSEQDLTVNFYDYIITGFPPMWPLLLLDQTVGLCVLSDLCCLLLPIFNISPRSSFSFCDFKYHL